MLQPPRRMLLGELSNTMNSTFELLTNPITFAIIAYIACGACNGIKQAKMEGRKTSLFWCARYCIGYFGVHLLAIAATITFATMAIFFYTQN